MTQESTDTTRRMSVSSDEKRNDKRLRQRNKFLSVFLGPKKKTKDNDKVKGQGQTKTQSKPLKSLSEGSKIAKWQPMIPVPASTLQRSETMASTRTNKTQTTPTPTQTAPAPTTLPAAARRRSPPQRTDTSGSEEMAHHQRFSQLRQKSQVIHQIHPHSTAPRLVTSLVRMPRSLPPILNNSIENGRGFFFKATPICVLTLAEDNLHQLFLFLFNCDRIFASRDVKAPRSPPSPLCGFITLPDVSSFE